MKRIFALCAGVSVVGVFLLGCGGNDAPKIPLGAAQATTSAPANPPMSGPTGEARVALDSGNALFRAKAYDQALEQYQRSADLAPSEVAPLLGIMMVADVKKDSKLAEATVPRIRKINAELADSSLISPHSKMIQTHPTVGKPPST
jgi:hypothetical protein